ncbi:porphobilinogen deaminase [Enterococcus florum]|uniref:Porphobilinogen deaminase n=1 Tax=Enterococcus florum TaxID=2480627 RepID=A0A4P5PIB1_9ENTE|nr:hydroxymethylbilane synthase [Enterococcus florum]GCF95392.1 porphobilinogen deaminase [Enterococcus florum]
MNTLRVGTRKSPLAIRQTQLVVDQLKKINPSLEIEIVGLSTKGDRLQQAPLTQIGGKGVFVKEVEYQLQEKAIDFAVHSLKDLPARLPEDLVLAATPKRAMPYDCLILKEAKLLSADQNIVIGTSSIRRAKQILRLYPNAEIVPIRGKIETRLNKMVKENMDGTILACAGLERMNYFSQLSAFRILTPEECVPAVGQGILGVECRREDSALQQLLAQLTDSETQAAAEAERYFLHQMDGNCDIPVGAFAKRFNEAWEFYGFLAETVEAEGKQIRLTGKDPLSLAKDALKQLMPNRQYC